MWILTILIIITQNNKIEKRATQKLYVNCRFRADYGVHSPQSRCASERLDRKAPRSRQLHIVPYVVG